MGQLVYNMKSGVKTGSTNLFLFLVKLFSGAVLGVTLALIGQEILGYKTFGFFCVNLVTIAVFLRAAKKWQLPSVLIFDLICVLLGLILRMYILIAPNL